MEADLIIIGGGLAGLTTANRALELGLRPIVLEKGKEADYPCNSRYSGGLFHVAFKDVTKPVEDIEAAVKAAGDFPQSYPGGDSIQSIMSEDAAKALSWLREGRAKFIKGGQPEFMRWMLAPPRPRGAGLDWKGRGPDVLLRRLTEALQEVQASPRLGWRAIQPIIEDEHLVGVIAEGPNGQEQLRARAIVIADGGFQANMDLMQRYVSPKPQALLQRGGGTGMGDGLTIAETAGAALIGLDSFYGHLLGRDAIENPKLWPYPVVDTIARSAILVDQTGLRFTDEGLGGVSMANAVAKLADPMSSVVIFDEETWTGVAADNRYPPCMNPVYENAGGKVFAAPSLNELALNVGVDPDGLSRTVDGWNDAVDTASFSNLSPPRSVATFQPEPIRKPPFRAIPVIAGITYTMGGIAINRDARALDQVGNPIRGLYAVGSASGGIEGGPSSAYIGGLAKAVITGLRAAESIAKER